MAKQIGDILVEKKLVTEEELQRALAEQEKTGEFLGSALIRMGCISEEQLLQSLSEQLNIPFTNLKHLTIDRAVIQRVPARLVEHYKVMPIRWERDVLTIALSNLHRYTWALEDIGLHLGCEVRAVLACRDQVSEAIRKYYGVGAETIETILAQKQGAGALVEPSVGLEEKAEDIERRAEDASVIKLVDQILQEAIQQRATDIHIEPDRDELAVRYRVDGILYDTRVSPDIKYLYSAIVSRIKIMARLDIAERRVPQDGRIKIRVGQRELDLRVSILPSVYGEHVVIRILPTDMLFSLEQLGLLPEDLDILQRIIREPHGMILVTGPTGSGKTTTLYASLSKWNTRQRKIITGVDPIEYELRGIAQIHVGIPPYLITSAATAFIAHRLVRLICAECRHEVSAPTTTRILVGGEPIPAYRGKGCEACRFTGYHGRTGIYEILTVNDRIKELIMERASSDILKKEAIRVGMKTLYQDGLKKAAAGLPTSEEGLMTTQRH